jgi:alkylation response protein AidB-like acyl-CoA dehydrogenase
MPVIWHTAWVLDRGERGTHESSMAKVICSEAIWRVVDRSMQILGGLGITDDTIVAPLPRCAPLPHLGRPLRGPPLVDRPPLLRAGGAGA